MVKLLLLDVSAEPLYNLLFDALELSDNLILNMLLDDGRACTDNSLRVLFNTAAYKGKVPIMRRLINHYKSHSDNIKYPITLAGSGNQYGSLFFLE